MIELDGGDGASVVQEVTITGPAEQRLELDVPVGMVEGRVLGPDGPVAGIAVTLLPDEEGLSTVGLTRTTTGADGRFAVEKLPTGTWAAQAGGSERFFPDGSEGKSYTLARVGGIAVTGGRRVQIGDLVVGAAGVILGTVLTEDSQPAAGALVRALRSTGEEDGCADRTDELGRFSLSGLAPGSWTVHALQGLDQAAEADVAVAGDGQTKVDLRLAPATHLRVVVRDAAGAPVKARVKCMRSDGADFTDWRARSRGRAPEGEHRLSPLPPGTYTLWAEGDGATSKVKIITLKGEPESLVELLL
jgi:sarcosine oxidase gamma subunit